MNKFIAIVCAVMIGLPAYGQSVVKTMKHLPDTGDTTGYTATFGEDNDFSIFLPFFIDNGNGTITDTVTGLMWQKSDGGEMSVDNARLYCGSLTLGGYTNWRLPNAREAFSILNLNRLNPALDTNFFTNSHADYWWSGDMDVTDTTKIWVTNAGGGIGNHPRSETISAGGVKSFHVRAVRDFTLPPLLPQHYTDNGNGTITDNLTLLVWQKLLAPDTLIWDQALTYADTLTLAGYNDWRLPNIKELQSIADLAASNPAMNPIFTVGSGVKYYWSSTTQFNNGANAWYLNSLNGITTYIPKTRNLYTLCVRGNAFVPTGIRSVSCLTSNSFAFPNPADNYVTICFSLHKAKTVKLVIINFLGIKVLEQRITECTDGLNQYVWEAKNMPEGNYFYSIEVIGNDQTLQTSSGKFLLVK